MAVFFRFQGTRELEHTSLHDDIIEAGIRLENGEDADDVFTLYEATLAMRQGVSADELFALIKDAEGDLATLQGLTEQYPLCGVCCYDADTDSEPAEFYAGVAVCASYGVLFEGTLIGDCGDGLIAKPHHIVRVWEL